MTTTKRRKYTPPKLREAKELADQCGKAYYEAMWREPKLRAERFMLESFSQAANYDCTLEFQELDRAIAQAATNLPLAWERLREARAQLAGLRDLHARSG